MWCEPDNGVSSHPLTAFRRNVIFATTSCLTRTSHGAFYSNDAVFGRLEPLLVKIADETIAVGVVIGYDKEELESQRDDLFQYTKATFQRSGAVKGHKASTLLDLEEGKPFELEVLLGEVVRKAHNKGVAVPT